MMRVAAVNDVHGNIDALDAVLAEVDAEPPDAIVFGGDVSVGPFAAEVLDRLMSLENAYFVQGNADRELVTAFDEGLKYDPDEDHLARRAGGWVAERLSRDQRDFAASFEDTVTLDVDGLGPTLFCHGSPRSDSEIITKLTPEERLAEFVSRTQEHVVVCGHTHMQFDRRVGGTRVLNAGSVGMPYEGKRGAFWLLLGPDANFRRTDYDVEAFVARMRAEADYFEADDFAAMLLRPLNPDEVAAFFEGIGPEPSLGER
jgi:predicted phosphodiesterase